MVRLEHISKSYSSVTVVRDISFDVQPASTLALIGPSGCGKSTLLRLIAGLIAPDMGQLYVCDQQLNDSTRSAIRDRLGYVIQDGGLFPHLTAEQNITLAARVRSWSADRIQDRVSQLLEITGFPVDGLRRFPAQLSGGQRQRVGLMRALMTDPDVLLLDEPLGALDPIIRRELQIELRQIFQQLQKTVLLVTHDLQEADWFADRIVLLRAGEIVQSGTSEQLRQEPAEPFVTQFIDAQSSIRSKAAS